MSKQSRVSRSARLFAEAKKRIPSGVNSPVRAFQAVGGHPLFIKKGQGPFVWDEDGKKYLDFCSSWGPLFFGHAPEGLIKLLQKEMQKGTSFGAATEKEIRLAQKVHELFPSIQKCRLVNSGTEAVMSAIRLARGYTGRKKILKIDGGYHGHVDSLLIKAGSGGATFGVPDSAGIPEELSRLTLTIPFNDIKALERIFKKEGKNIAAMILEPVPGNMGVVLPRPGYLALTRLLTKKYGSLLIFDEVISGFRVSPGGAQSLYGVQPDLTCLGKIAGGGFPLAVFGGKKEMMDQLAPQGAVYQAGTLSGNPVAVTAGLWMLNQLSKKSVWTHLGKVCDEFFKELTQRVEDSKLPLQLNYLGSMFTLFFTSDPVTDYASAKKSDTKKFARFFKACSEEGLYLAPSQFETNFISSAHTSSQLARALRIFKKYL